jgi:hypothetical protein
VEQAVEVSVLQEHHYIAVLLLTDIVLEAHTTITAERSVITLVEFGLPVVTAATLTVAADLAVQHF